MDLLQKLGKPFEQDISRIVNYARSVLDTQEESAGLIEEMLGMETEWKNDHATKLKEMTAFLQRAGIVPMGGVEAMTEKKSS